MLENLNISYATIKRLHFYDMLKKLWYEYRQSAAIWGEKYMCMEKYQKKLQEKYPGELLKISKKIWAKFER